MTKSKLAVTIRKINKESSSFKELKNYFDLSYINKTGKRLSENEVISAIHQADAVLAGTEPFTEQVIYSTDTLKVISRVGAGLDNIDLKNTSDKNIKVCNTPNAPTLAVAEHTIALIFTLYKNIVVYNRINNEYHHNPIMGTLLSGKKVGIIGLGRIGFKVAEMLFAAGCKIGYYDPYLTDKSVPEEWTSYSTINQLLSKSNIVTLHMPSISNNSPIINKTSFEYFKKGSILINTARSSLIDEKSLIDALDKEIISGAGLDVYDSIIEDQIQNYPQIILTPHIASNTTESREEMEREAIENLIKSIKEINL